MSNLLTNAPPGVLLDARGLSLRFRGVQALSGVDFQIEQGQIFSVIGPNGAGKTSLLNCISGRYKPSEGQITFAGEDITRRPPRDRAGLGIGRTFQNLALFGHMSV